MSIRISGAMTKWEDQLHRKGLAICQYCDWPDPFPYDSYCPQCFACKSCGDTVLESERQFDGLCESCSQTSWERAEERDLEEWGPTISEQLDAARRMK